VLNDVTSTFGPYLGFVSWVPSHLEEMALANERAEHGGAPAEIAPEDITGTPPEPTD
jgi:hypothetical protein